MAGPSIESGISDSLVRRATDCTTRPGKNIGTKYGLNYTRPFALYRPSLIIRLELSHSDINESYFSMLLVKKII